jgi:hypothetical protein
MKYIKYVLINSCGLKLIAGTPSRYNLATQLAIG